MILLKQVTVAKVLKQSNNSIIIRQSINIFKNTDSKLYCIYIQLPFETRDKYKCKIFKASSLYYIKQTKSYHKTESDLYQLNINII